MGLYIKSSAQISIQNPLCNDWAVSPIIYREPYARAVECDYKKYINPIAARRMGKILKRAIAVSSSALSICGAAVPDAIITGTGLGCIENTEKFLSAMTMEGEEFLQPAYFINSTHNTISSQIAIFLKCHGYNNTFVQRGISFESALLDALMLFETGTVNTALVEGHDEMTQGYFKLLDKLDYWRKEADGKGAVAGETAVGFFLSKEEDTVKIEGTEILHTPSMDDMSRSLLKMCSDAGISLKDIDAVMVGANTDEANDAVYEAFSEALFHGVPCLWWKHIFGESFTSAAFGMYVADYILRNRVVPSAMVWKNSVKSAEQIRKILIYNHFNNKEHSLILLSRW